MTEFLPQHSKYFISHKLPTIVDNVNKFRRKIFPNYSAEEDANVPDFPSVSIVGLGRCGSNISLDVVSLVSKAKQSYLDEISTGATELPTNSSHSWLKNLVSSAQARNKRNVFLVEPVVLVGDLDRDISGRIHYTASKQGENYLVDYSKLSIMNFNEVHAGGAGNAPILGQYLAKVILNKDIDTFLDESWRFAHSYLIDSCGISANQSRLYFYIFSAGGGTGSGMAAEFGMAQQYSYMSKTFDSQVQTKSAVKEKTDKGAFVYEPIFTCGIGILPNITSQTEELSEALHINAGRLLCRYLAEEMEFSENDAAFEETEAKDKKSVQAPIKLRPWNALMLISNDIMKYASKQSQSDKAIDVNAMEKYANQYISQQIFNILTAQALTADYDETYFRKAGINIVETIRLDANDLFMSLSGPVAIAYAEQVIPHGTDSNQIDIDDLFCRSIDLPHFNDKTNAIEGISILPVASEKYQNVLKRFKDSNYSPSVLEKLHFFKNCSSTVTIISLPKDYKLSYSDLNKLKLHLNNIFPNTTLKRYSLVIGASANLSLTTIIAKSPCLSDEFLTLLVSYIKRCFAKVEHRFDESLDEKLLQLITAENYEHAMLDSYLNKSEDPAMILDANWYAIKPMYEKKYREMIPDGDKFIGVDEIKISLEQVKKAIVYLRHSYRHRVSKTRMLSLSDASFTPSHTPEGKGKLKQVK